MASIRRWYPRIPISLVKDETNGSFDTEELQRAWNVQVLETGSPILGREWAALEPLLLPGGQRCLVLDSDIVFIGNVLEPLEALDADFIVERNGGNPAHLADQYFDVATLERFDPEFVFPGYTFNTGQLVATSGILKRADFEPAVRLGEGPQNLHPDVFVENDQGVLNYVLLKKAQRGEVSLARVDFMLWGPSVPRGKIRVRQLTSDSPYRYLVHWAGWKGKFFLPLKNGSLLRHFEREYYSRVRHGQARRLGRCLRLTWRVITHAEPFHTKPQPARFGRSPA